MLARRSVLAVAVALPGLGRPASANDRELVLFAATSLKEALGDLAATFEKAHPGVKVRLNVAGSRELRNQIAKGAAGDVFAAADLQNMAELETKGLVRKSAVFARNQPVIVVPRANPAGIRSLADLAKAKHLAIGAPETSIGGYTLQIFDAAASKLGAELRAKLDGAIVSREPDVHQVLAKVSRGEADAGIVYRTDAQSAKDGVTVVRIPDDVNVMAEYPIAPVAASKDPTLAQALVALVLSEEGQRRLAAAGFLAAPVASARR